MKEILLVKLFLLAVSLAVVLGIIITLSIWWLGRNRYRYEREKSEMLLKYQRDFLEEHERVFAHVSRDVHDSLAHNIALFHIMVAEANKLATGERQKELLSFCTSLARQTVEEARGLAQQLDQVYIVAQGLESLVRYNLKIVGKLAKLEYELQVEGNLRLLAPQATLLTFRIIQEALNNASRHAKAKKVSVSIAYHAPNLTCSIKDDGKGFSPDEKYGKGSGLRNMGTRARLIGGELSIDSAAGMGTEVGLRATIPPLERPLGIDYEKGQDGHPLL